MILKRKVKSVFETVSVGILLGVSVSLILTMLCALVLTWLIHSEIIQDDAIGYCIMAALLLTSMSGAWTASAKTKQLRAQVCLITGAVYYLALLAMTAVFFGGKYQGVGVTAVVVVLGCMITILAGLKVQKGKRMKIKKSSYC